ncbi:S8 family serine peptidase [Dokdonia sp. Hel_I_53]|uniref:S8 family serine peptidase n=1 Tax=Dokdonia sp. Hel_I_53 TaxID=1566287 RepID=UPI00119BF2C9|nr:S8 family serine peptidase [Dokdonia sp. Hel_I_53]TVZ52586.1 peptidase inhibitor I9 [Dokdonia sp. Hel_I_53]
MNKNVKILGVILAAAAIGCTNDATLSDSDLNVEESLTIEMNEDVGSAQDLEGRYIVVYNTDFGKSMNAQSSKEAVLSLTQEILGTTRSAADLGISNVYSKSINGVALSLNENQRALLNKDNRVKYIEQDRIVQFAPPCGTPNGGPCDGNGGGGDDGGSSAQETPWGISRVNGGVAYTGNSVAWILDSGVDLDHQDLNVDASRGYNAFTSGKDGRSLDDGNGHGTHVAGTIAALDNNLGVIGVAAGATVIPVKVLDSRGSGSYSGVVAGVDHVAANGSAGDVANMSLGGPISVALEDAIKAAAQSGVRFMLAAGNEAQDANNVSPARVNGNNIYTISSMAQGDNWSSFSNFGNPPVDYCAPGSAIKSTWKGGGYNTISGTSMATPHAAGVLLLGNASSGGTVNGDPDGNADTIIVH